jgi:hypothetical protein
VAEKHLHVTDESLDPEDNDFFRPIKFTMRQKNILM